ncbi:hypothetical protein [Nitrospira sp. Nam74]
MIHDYIVVGSGATGAQAAQTLVEHGAKVAMLDVGHRDEKYKDLIPNQDFTTLRQQDTNQHRYFVGDELEGIPWGKVKVGAQLTPSRQFMVRDVERLIPLLSGSFTPMESLAYGGLGNGWGLGCFVFSDPELDQAGLDRLEMKVAYETVSRRIGISGVRDDAAAYTLGDLKHYQPPLRLDQNCHTLYETYRRKRLSLNHNGFFMGQPCMAILTEDLGDRKQTSYHDMDFYADHGLSAYRPWITTSQLLKHSSFTYQPNCLVLKFEEHGNYVSVFVHRTDTNQKDIFQCKKLVLAPGVLGTARIVLRSFRDAGRLPLICNHYCYVPCLQPAMLGQPIEQFKSSMAQLVLYHDQDRTHTDVAVACLFSYRSLLLFRLLKEMPLNYADGRSIMQYLQSSFVIAGIHHPDSAGSHKTLRLVEDDNSITGDSLRADYSMTGEETAKTDRRERKYLAALRKLRCYPIKRVYPGFGASIHYGGTLPVSLQEKAFTLAPDGKLHGTKRVFVADGSSLKYLPAKGLTFSLMANAHRVAQKLVRHEQECR